ncbi:Taf5p [Saccharomyces cerevisiae YJM1248]|nr:Taf5p [Saccharomyces cerevisiae YJM1439]AJP98647.1 Taf5p [Saccharomyces cerevisiae YJM1248]AJQ06313.1 Taf5p [Saccharomyces cerevisiae YJM627]CAD6467156.1 Y55_G0016260.mRNA.1.CDS.1 [Saccharomyces cerevisiae]CAH1828413.1 unnamed protein product [Saccharomyces cerevisiae]
MSQKQSTNQNQNGTHQPQPVKNQRTNNAAGANSGQQPQQQSQGQSQQQGRSNGPFSASDLNRIVLEYLNKKGYHRTEAMLRAESGRTLTPQNKQSPANTKTGKFPEQSSIPPNPGKTAKPISNPTNLSSKRDAEGGIVSSGRLEGLNAPENYIRAYSMLKNWVDSSLEIYKPELSYIMYPIFIYLFLNLVAKNPVYARRFFDRFSPDFKDFHGSEINRLFSVNSIDHIKENEVASAFQSHKYRITMSKTTLNLLLYFLNENESIGGSLIISVINQHLDPNIVESVTAREKLADGIKVLSDSENGNGKQNLEMNSVPVKLGPFPKDEEFVKEIETELKIKDDQEKQLNQQTAGDNYSGANNRTLLQEYKAMNNEKFKDNTGDDDKDKIKDKIAKDEEKKESELKVDGEKKDSNLSSPARDILPLPPKTALDLKLEIQKVKESRDAIKLDNLQLALPSVCMYTFQNTNKDMSCLNFSDDCRIAAAGFQDSYIKIWSLDGSSLNNPNIALNNNDKDEDPTCKTLVGHSGTVYSTSFSPDNKYLLSGSEDKTVRLWSMDTHTALVSYKGHNHPVWDVSFSPLGHYFATASHDQTARLWSCDHIYPLRIFAGHLNDVDCVSFHPNGCYVFTGSSDKTCRMWDVSTGDSVRLFLGHTAPVISIAVCPDGRWLSTGSEDGIINVWDIGTGKRLKQMRGHGKNAIYSLSYSKEGNVLISGGADHTVRVWDLKKATTEPSAEPDEPFIGYLGDVTASINQDIKEYGRRRTVIPTSDLVASFYTKKTPVFKVKFSRSNLALAGGAFRP